MVVGFKVSSAGGCNRKVHREKISVFLFVCGLIVLVVRFFFAQRARREAIRTQRYIGFLVLD